MGLTWTQTRRMLNRGRHPRPLGPPAGNADGRPTRPDRLSIWPTDDEHFGIDVLYVGVQGYRRAEIVFRQIEASGVKVKLLRQGATEWVVRFGPVDRDDMLTVLNGYVW
jgi:hypothetical protein